MCGIAGILGEGGGADNIRRITSPLKHRGPDAEGFYTSPRGDVSLGHQRLAIIDLAEAANQPMMSPDGRVALVFNGEIYNYLELKAELESLDCRFNTKSDTETLLAAYLHWGPSFVNRLIGMFAYALWDDHEKKLHLGRDRLGVKPLYYYRGRRFFVFASEVRSLLAHPKVERGLSSVHIAEFLELGYVKAPNTVFSEIKKLRPGHTATVDTKGEFSESPYWTVERCFRTEPRSRSIDDAADELEALLLDSFKKRMISDVPVGVFLSGGLDSTLLATLLSRKEGMRLRTFTIGFMEESHNEADLARDTACHLKTDHTEKFLSLDEAKLLIHKVPSVYDEPLADTSVIPTMFLSQLASESVKVVLSSDGGDELFGGYRRYQWGLNCESFLDRIPRVLTEGVSKGLGLIGAEKLAGAYSAINKSRFFSGFLPVRNLRSPKDKISKFLGILEALTPLERYLQFNRAWSSKDLYSLLGCAPESSAGLLSKDILTGPLLNAFTAYDLKYYLPDDICLKVDSATMAHSIEGRDPYMDHRLVEFAAGLPIDMKIRDGRGKFILRHILKRYLPEHMVERPKKGFSIPVASWLTSDRIGLVRKYLSPEAVARCDLFEPFEVKKLVNGLMAGDSSQSPKAYGLITFMMWKEHWGL